jgi:hypothetical protein
VPGKAAGLLAAISHGPGADVHAEGRNSPGT